MCIAHPLFMILDLFLTLTSDHVSLLFLLLTQTPSHLPNHFASLHAIRILANASICARVDYDCADYITVGVFSTNTSKLQAGVDFDNAVYIAVFSTNTSKLQAILNELINSIFIGRAHQFGSCL